MPIKIKLRGNGKALVKFDKPMDEQYFTWIIMMHRDDSSPHPKISIKNNQGKEIPAPPKKQAVAPKVELTGKPPEITKAEPMTKPPNNPIIATPQINITPIPETKPQNNTPKNEEKTK